MASSSTSDADPRERRRPRRVALYARVSTTDQTLDPQVHELRALAERRGWKIAGEYLDHGISGAKDRRPGLDQMMRDSHRGKFDIVMVVKFDRFARSLRHLVTALDDLTSRGIDFVSASDAVDSTSPGGRFQIQILGAVAEFERELCRQRTLAGLAAAKRRGKRLGKPPARIDEDRLLDLRSEGKSLRQIATELGMSKSFISKRLKGVHMTTSESSTGPA